MLDVRDDLELANYQLDTVNIFSDSGFWVDKKKGGIRNWRKHISDIGIWGFLLTTNERLSPIACSNMAHILFFNINQACL
jgi:hypothetical protein